MHKTSMDELVQRLHSLQAELESEIDHLLREKRHAFRYSLEQGKVRFEQGVKALHRREKVALWLYLRRAKPGHILTAPVIYSLIVPFMLVDLMVTFYQQICFRAYGIPRVVRGRYVVIDRHHLAYLNVIEKLNCLYCGYCNGVLEYVREVSARTEQYWCPIKHALRTPDPHHLTDQFVDYGDAENYKNQLQKLRKEMATLKRKAARPSGSETGEQDEWETSTNNIGLPITNAPLNLTNHL